jgi:hypothetical protein
MFENKQHQTYSSTNWQSGAASTKKAYTQTAESETW